MSTRTTAQKNARRLQRLAEDELGSRPKLTACHDILARTPPCNGDRTREEWLTAVFFENRDRLAESAKLRASANESDAEGK